MKDVGTFQSAALHVHVKHILNNALKYFPAPVEGKKKI
jgi:hypothetical protein